MANDLKKHIKYLLDNSHYVMPIPTSVDSCIPKIKEIKAVVLDIYGTMLISSSGDVEKTDLKTSALLKAIYYGNYIIKETINSENLDYILWYYKKTIVKHQNIKKNKETLYPEVDIKAVWNEVIELFVDRKVLIKKHDSSLEKFVVTFEIYSNPVCPMPHLLETITFFKEKQIPLGIVSNAQFYTPYILNYFLKNTLTEDNVEPFDKDICVFSYKHKKGKPDTYLYKLLLPVFLKKYNIKPHEILFVGNDMLKDVYAAQKTGMKTALFAGDKRSLRLREEESLNIKPDIIITDLFQLTKINII